MSTADEAPVALGSLEQAISEIESRFSLDETRRFVDSLKASQRGITR